MRTATGWWPSTGSRSAELRSFGGTVATGRFAARMAVELVTDGPVTILLG